MSGFLKDYEPVEDRLRAFWSDHPDGRVLTVLLDHGDGEYIVRAEVFRSDGELPAASGLARDSTAELPPNMRGSALEVCETSAIGRALANLGYAPKGKRPSREEMSKASRAPGGQEPANVAQDAVGAAPGPSGTEPGEGSTRGPVLPVADSSRTPSSGSNVREYVIGGRTFPVKPEDCNHRFGSGNWLTPIQIEGMAHCPRCGMKTVLYRESDVGP